MHYFSNYDWDRDIFKLFLKIHVKTGASIIYDDDNLVVVNITTFSACHMLLGNGEMDKLCYATYPVLWSYYFNRPNSKLIAVFNFNLPREDVQSLFSISTGYAQELHILNRAHHYWFYGENHSHEYTLYDLNILGLFSECNNTKYLRVEANYGVCLIFEGMLHKKSNFSQYHKECLNNWFREEIINKNKYYGHIFNEIAHK